MNNSNTITVVGAGLVGSLWSCFLRDRGFNVDIFEKRSDFRLAKKSEARSINLVITSRGIHALTQAGLFAKARDISVPIYGRMIHSRTGKTVYQPYGRKDEFNLSISRLELNKLLLDSASAKGARVHFDYSVQNIDFKKHEATFTSHSGPTFTQQFTALYGTDGAGSSVRKFLCDHLNENYKESIEWLDIDYIELYIPARENNEYKIEQNALHIWPRGHHMMMALANLDGSFTVTLYMPKNNSKESFAELQTEEQVATYFKREFPDAIDLMPDYIEAFLNNPRGKLGTVRCQPWLSEDGSVALAGDAAHAIVPFFGQGMNCGFEDLTVLGKHLDKKSLSLNDVNKEYFREQKQNADAIATMAVENWHEMSKKVADQNFLLQKKLEAEIEKCFPQQFKSRYGMVTYTLVPYVKILEAGKLHQNLISELLPSFSKNQTLDTESTSRALGKYLLPFNQQNNIHFS